MRRYCRYPITSAEKIIREGYYGDPSPELDSGILEEVGRTGDVLAERYVELRRLLEDVRKDPSLGGLQKSVDLLGDFYHTGDADSLESAVDALEDFQSFLYGFRQKLSRIVDSTKFYYKELMELKWRC